MVESVEIDRAAPGAERGGSLRGGCPGSTRPRRQRRPCQQSGRPASCGRLARNNRSSHQERIESCELERCGAETEGAVRPALLARSTRPSGAAACHRDPWVEDRAAGRSQRHPRHRDASQTVWMSAALLIYTTTYLTICSICAIHERFKRTRLHCCDAFVLLFLDVLC